MDQSRCLPRFGFTSVPFWLNTEDVGNGQLSIINAYGNFLNSALRLLNITLTEVNIIETDSLMEFGNILEDGTATGLIGMHLRNETDIALFPLTPNWKAFEFIDYTQPFNLVTWRIISVTPITTTSNTFAVLETFSLRIWIIIFMAFQLIYLMTYISAKLYKSSFTLSNEYLNILAIFVQQGYNTNREFVVKYVWMFWVMPLSFLTMFFCGMFLSRLTLPDSNKYFDSLEDLLSKPNLRVDIPKETTLHYFLTDPISESRNAEIENPEIRNIEFRNAEIRKAIYEQAERTEGLFETLSLDVVSLFSDMSQGRKVIIMDTNTILFALVNMLDCDQISYKIHQSKDLILIEHYSFLFRRGFSSFIISKFKLIVLLYIEGDIFTHDLTMIFNQKPSCLSLFNEEEITESRPIKLEDFKFPLIIYAAGNIFSIVVIGYEVFHGLILNLMFLKRREPYGSTKNKLYYNYVFGYILVPVYKK